MNNFTNLFFSFLSLKGAAGKDGEPGKVGPPVCICYVKLSYMTCVNYMSASNFCPYTGHLPGQGTRSQSGRTKNSNQYEEINFQRE